MVCQSTTISNEQLAKTLIENKYDLAKLIDDYWKMDATLKTLTEEMENVKKANDDSAALVASMQQTIDQLQDRNDVMKELILASEQTNQKQVQTFKDALDEANKRARKNFWKGLLYGAIIGGVVVGVALK